MVNINKEILIITIPAFSWILFSAGGYKYKILRRYILPLLLGITVLISGIPLINAVGGTIALSVALCLPYGDKVPLIAKFGVICTYPLATLLWGFTWFQPIYVVVVFGLFWLSLKGKLTHKIMEGFAGLGLGIIAISL